MKFIQGDTTEADIWLYELAHIHEEHRIAEPMLRQTRWFDYRNKLPMTLTQIFADEYRKVYADIYSMSHDYEYAEKVTGGLMQSDLISLWLARQSADRIGCPYSFYIRYAMMRTFERAWKYIPRPNQLYGEELILDAEDAWMNAKRDMLFLAEGSFYKNESYISHPDQISYHSYLIENVKVRPVPEMILTRLIFREKCLTEELAVSHFGEDTFRAASKHFHAI